VDHQGDSKKVNQQEAAVRVDKGKHQCVCSITATNGKYICYERNRICKGWEYGDKYFERVALCISCKIEACSDDYKYD
jgi:hypothetical protein